MAKPLTKKKKNGELYARPVQIDQLIDQALSVDLGELRRRALLQQGDPQYLRSEVLVHVIRQDRNAADGRRLGTLLPILLRRCLINLMATISDSRRYDAIDLREQVVDNFALLFAEDIAGNDELDYFEVNFNAAFRTFRIDAVRDHKRLHRSLAPLPDMQDPVDNDEGATPDDDVFARLSEAYRVPPDQEQHVFLSELQDAINCLPDKERSALVLHVQYNLKIESEDPLEMTVASVCKTTGRTIRNRLASAARLLANFKENK